MSNLVFIENNQPMTDSITVADSFGKTHDKVLRGIRELGCSEEFRLANFGEFFYINQQGQKMPRYIMSEQGFTLLVMGYTGQSAMEFKEKYITEFHMMREGLAKKKQAHVVLLSNHQALIQSLKLTAELADEVEEVKGIAQTHSQKLAELEQKVEEQITLDHGQQRALQKAIARRVYAIESSPILRRDLFSQLYREIRDRWAVASYRDVRRTELQQVLRYVDAWIPRRTA